MANPDVNLPNKPLVEAILEIRWRLAEVPGSGTPLPSDPLYKLLPGRFFDRVRSMYPAFTELPAAQVPSEMIPHLVQYQYRASENGWPLTQIGPGVLTLNDTERYGWSDFRERSIRVVADYYEAYPEPAALIPEVVMLRYLDGVELDDSDPGDFLRGKLKVGVSLPDRLVEDERLLSAAQQLDFSWGFPLKDGGSVNLKFSTGLLKGKKAIIWQTQISGLPQLPDGFPAWLDDAHSLVHEWFFTLIDGELLERFRHA